MDRAERITGKGFSDQASMSSILAGLQRGIWTALPGIVHDVSKLQSQGTIDVQPALTVGALQPDSTIEVAPLPLLLDCPVVLVGGGGCVATFPIAVNDECLVIFASRSINNWWAFGGIQAQSHWRFHNLSDGFAIVGLRSKPNWMKGYSLTTCQLRSLDGSTYTEVDPGNQQVNVVAPQGMLVTAPFLHCTGEVKAGFGSANQVDLQTHTHPQGADSHGDSEADTGAPIAEAANTP